MHVGHCQWPTQCLAAAPTQLPPDRAAAAQWTCAPTHSTIKKRAQATILSPMKGAAEPWKYLVARCAWRRPAAAARLVHAPKYAMRRPPHAQPAASAWRPWHWCGNDLHQLCSGGGVPWRSRRRQGARSGQAASLPQNWGTAMDACCIPQRCNTKGVRCVELHI